MIDVLVIGIIIVIIGMALVYIRRSKKRGDHCIGCSACSSKETTCACEHKQ